MAINDWDVEHRPRERLLQNGPDVLSDAELLALLLRTGSRGRSALDLARHLLATSGGLGGLTRVSSRQLLAHPGLGPGKVATWLACLEMGRRVLKAELAGRNLMTEIESAKAYIVSRLRHLDHEVFFALYLDQTNRLIGEGILSEGTVSETAVYPREVVRKAIEMQASAVIVAHNHPAGSLRASVDDINITQRLRAALRTVDIHLHDHVIVAGPVAVSLRATTRLFQEELIGN